MTISNNNPTDPTTTRVSRDSWAGLDSSERRLRELGYRQELKRELTSFSNFSVSFSIISILTGISSLYGNGLVSGGPVVLIWGWPVVSFFTLVVALCMGEICSSFPTSGGLYFWSAKMASPAWSPLVSWFTGYFNMIGQIATAAGVDFGLAVMLGATISIATNGSFVPTPLTTVGIYFLILIVHGLLNTFAVKLIAIFNTISVWWHIFGVLAIVLSVLIAAPKRQSFSFVFTQFENGTGWSSPVYASLIGLLAAQFTMTGYDASACMSEETKRADVAGPVGVIMSVIVSFFAGWIYLLGLTFGIQDYDSTVGTTTGSAVAQIFLDTLGTTGAILCLVIVMGGMFFAGNATITSNSRMVYAFSRDGALPGSKHLHKIHDTFKTPVVAVWLSCSIAALMGLPYLGNSTAFTAITSLATISLYLAYGMPILCRLLNPSSFQPGPISMGKFSVPLGITACFWVAFITVLFVLPTSYPVTPTNMNYTSVALIASTLLITLYWVLSAKYWFKGPKIAADLAPISKEANQIPIEDEV